MAKRQVRGRRLGKGGGAGKTLDGSTPLSGLAARSTEVVRNFGQRLRGHLDKQFDTPPDMLYHYTSAAGLKGILENGVIWASHYAYLNDPAEIREGSKFIKEALAESVSKPANEAATLFERSLGLIPKLVERDTYLTSLSESGDDLPQWLLYADGGRGFSIGLDLRKHNGDHRLSKVLYDRKEFDKRTRELLETAENIWKEEAKNTAPTEKLAKAQRGVCAEHLLGVLEWANRYKTDSWKHEQEWRLHSDLFHAFGRNDGVGVRLRGSVLIPYTEVKLWDKPSKDAPVEEFTPTPIREIILGPLQDPATGSHAVNTLWRHLRLQRPPERRESADSVLLRRPKVRKSKIEYRQT